MHQSHLSLAARIFFSVWKLKPSERKQSDVKRNHNKQKPTSHNWLAALQFFSVLIEFKKSCVSCALITILKPDTCLAVPRWESPPTSKNLFCFQRSAAKVLFTTRPSLGTPAGASEGVWAMRAWLKIVRQTTGETHPLLLLLPQPSLYCFVRRRHQLSSNTTFTQKPCACCDILSRCGGEAAPLLLKK